VNRKTSRQQVEAVVTPMLTRGEQLRRSAPVWAVERRGKAPLLFREREQHLVALTDQRLILLTRPRRRRPLGVGNLVIAKRYSTFSLDRARRLRPMLQVRLRTADGRVLVLEFRPRDRRAGRDLATALGPSRPTRGHPVVPEPDPPRPTAAVPAPAPAPAPAPKPAPAAEPELLRFEPPPDESGWHKPDWDQQEAERERRTRKEKRQAKKAAKKEAKQARKQQQAGLSRKERRQDRKRRAASSDHDEMLQFIRK